MYLHRAGDFNNALKNYKQALAMNDNNVEIHYNIGLLYFDLEDYALAAEHAAEAYNRGYPLPGLKNKLATVGVDILVDSQSRISQ